MKKTVEAAEGVFGGVPNAPMKRCPRNPDEKGGHGDVAFRSFPETQAPVLWIHLLRLFRVLIGPSQFMGFRSHQFMVRLCPHPAVRRGLPVFDAMWV